MIHFLVNFHFSKENLFYNNCRFTCINAPYINYFVQILSQIYFVDITFKLLYLTIYLWKLLIVNSFFLNNQY